ncbi:protein kinase [Bacillaceae bacterium SIJ1]|uniref:protein kinase domain-containing protein n=1 Tax=Litoribacterium kuwaitense TaxID=1398745 RepID=UPI0013ECF925|nr:protein kinase [Litoribacterium kuwaitense]NGP46019.1 protein kinase [Litoribacterium kuwaitense]
MDQYNITDSDVIDILALHGLKAVSISKLPKSGQRQVFEVVFDSKKDSILKFVDVSPYIAYQRYTWNEFSVSELEQEKVYEIEANSKRIIRELEASKKCAILPQLEILDDYEMYIKENYHFIYYFETKFEGQTLDKSELYQKEQDIDVILQFLFQMVNQIRVMHDTGYVHRDLTPRNIIYHQGRFKIIDAGLVKSNEEEKLTATRALIGTPYYMAPEQERRTSDYTWDFRTDLYSVGLVAIEIFLPQTRYLDMKKKRDMHYVFPIWKSKDASSKSLLLFSKVIARLAIEQRSRRWADLDNLLHVLETLIGQEDE